MQQHMIQGFAAAAGGGDGDRQHLLELPLADVVRQTTGAQPILPLHTLRVSGLLRPQARSGIYQSFRAGGIRAAGRPAASARAGRP